MGTRSRKRAGVWLRRTGFGLLALVALMLVAATVLSIALRSPDVQQSILQGISERTREDFGVDLKAERLDIGLLGGRLDLHGLELRAGDGPPFAVIERLTVQARLVASLSGTIRLALVEIVRPELDSDAPLPPPPTGDAQATERPESLPITIERLRVVEAMARGAAPEALAGLLTRWRIDGLDVDGGFDGRTLTVSRMVARAVVERAEGSPTRLDVHGAGDLALSGEGQVDSLSIEGDGLSLEASLGLRSSWDQTSGRFRLMVDPGVWLLGAPTGEVTAQGQADLARGTGTLRLETRDQPGALLANLVAEDLAATAELSRSTFSVEADFELATGAGVLREVAGDAVLSLSRDRALIVEVDAQSRVSIDDQLPAQITVAARLLPSEPGSRVFSADLEAATGRELESWRITDGKIAVDQPNMSRLATAIAGLYPRALDPSVASAIPNLGRLDVRGDVEGRLIDPVVDVHAGLEQRSGGRVLVSARGRPLSADLSIEAQGTGVELTELVPEVAGRVDFAGTIRDPMGDMRASVELLAREIGTPESSLFESLGLNLDGGAGGVEWRLDGLLTHGGAVAGYGDLLPEKPLRAATGELSWQTGNQSFPTVDGSFALSGGTLAAKLIALPAETTAGPTTGSTTGMEPLEASVRVPLGALRATPGGKGLAKLPLEFDAGPVSVEWRAAKRDWRGLLPEAWSRRLAELDIARLEGGSFGRLALDPGCPACSVGTVELTEVAIEVGGRLAEAPKALAFELGDGTLKAGTWLLRGEGWDAGIETELHLAPDWRLGDEPAALIIDTRGDLWSRMDSAWLESLPVEVIAPGTIDLSATVSGPLEDLVGTGHFKTSGLQLAAEGYPAVVLGEPGLEVEVGAGAVRLSNIRAEINQGELVGFARARLADPLAEASGTFTLILDRGNLLPGIQSAVLPFSITSGRLLVEDGRLATSGGDGSLRLDVPIDGRVGARVQAEWEVPELDWAPLLAEIRGAEDPEVLRFASRGKLELPVDRPAAARAAIELRSGRIAIRGRETLLEPGLEIEIGEGRLRLAPFELRSGAESFAASGWAVLEDDWAFGDAPADLVLSFELAGNGDLDAGLLNPFLAGGRADGSLALALRIEGTPAAFGGQVTVEGPNASILYRSPYLARLERPSMVIKLADGRVLLERADLLLNEGPLTLSGVLADNGRTDLSVGLADSVFRLDYGLLATIGADLRYQSEKDGRSRLSGTVDAARGTLTRNVQLDLDLLSQLLAPIDLTTTEDDPLDLIDLELAVRTREGVRVKNNLGDLLVRWEPLEVSGTLARPVIEGGLEVDPGGLLYAYGQTVRLDRATIEYPGQEGLEPRLEIEATTSLEDPTIGRLSGDDPFRATQRRSEASDAAASAEITENLARYYGEQVAGRVGESVGVSVSLRPLLIFGETDPGARLTVSRDLSTNLALAASVDLRGAEARTYLLELHELRKLPRLVGQVFTDDESAYGGALLQRQEFGGSRRLDKTDLPRISKLVFDPPEGVSRRGIKRALALEKGDPFDEGQRFVAEVEVVDYLMHRGYPDARVSIRSPSDERRQRRVRLEMDIIPGPRVEFQFEGEKISAPLRRLIQSLYRPDFFEPESIEEMRSETVRALRSRGFLEPRVEIEVEKLVTSADRKVVVRAEGGVKISPDPPIFSGLPAADAAVLDVVFANAVQRVELAVGLQSADRRLLQALAGLGYPEARIVSRYQTLGERVLTVEIEPGPRQRIASVAVEGFTDDSLRGRLTVAEGDPLVRGQLSRSAMAIERELGARGFLDARVRTVLATPDRDDPLATEVRFVVEPGVEARLSAVDFQGLRSTRESYARRIVGLDIGESLARDDLARARTRLWRTGLFSAVGTETFETGSGMERVVFDLEERDRYRLTYGVRWDSEDGVGAVLDATDDNFLGRGWTLGLRALTSNEEDSLRWLTRVPRAFGGPGVLELFAAVRERTEISTDVIFGQVEVPVDILEGTLQYSHPVTERTTLRVYGRYTDTERQLPFFTLRVKNPQLGFQYLYDRRSPGPLTARGVLASIDLSGSDDFVGGDLRYARLFSQFSTFLPVGRSPSSRLSWAQAYRLGLAEAFDQQLIRDVRFFAGGEYSVRGYETESLGDQVRFGSVSEPTGGSALLVINQELRFRLFPDYTLVLFADAGNVWQERDDLGFDLFTSAGLGLRAVTPVGLLRLDLAHALDRRLEIDPEFKIYFGLGTTF